MRGEAPLWWVWLATWPVVAVFVLSNAATPLYLLWQRDLGFSRGTLTVVFACYIVGLLSSLLVCGVASDRWGRKPVLLPALGLAFVGCVLFATAGSVAALVAGRLLTGIAVGAAVSAGMAAVTDVAGPGRKRLGALLASCAMVFGAGLGPLLAGIVSETLPGPTVTVFLLEMVLLASAAGTVWRMPLHHPSAGAVPPGAATGTTASATTGTAASPASPASPATNAAAGTAVGAAQGAAKGAAASARAGSWVRVPRVPRGRGRQLGLGIAVFAPGLTATSFVLSLGPSLLADLLDSDSRVLAGAMAFVMFLASTAVQFGVQRLSRRTILAAGAAGTLLGMGSLVAAVHTSAVPVLVAAALLAGAGQGMGQLGGLSLLNASVPPERLAEANAALNVGGYAPAGLLAVSVGFLGDGFGLTTAVTLFATALAACAVAAATIVLTSDRSAMELA
ncbi:MFS transporter [Streptomyces sp. 796.1]|uniref:MFS transporter n=1 Tax=Streptomyces sp. 796.1 TaxID=3163029 RepID=UPI0039C9B191